MEHPVSIMQLWVAGLGGAWQQRWSQLQQQAHQSTGGVTLPPLLLSCRSAVSRGALLPATCTAADANAHASSNSRNTSSNASAGVSSPAAWRWRVTAAHLPLASLTAGSTSAPSPAAASSMPASSASSPGGSARSCCGSGGGKAAAAVSGAAAGSSTAAGRQAAGQGQELENLSGTWIKDRHKSESMEAAMNIMHLNGIVRQAVKLVRGVKIEHNPQNFTFTVFSFISWFKVKEVYPMSGEERQFRRRDLRRGKALGRVEPHGKHLHVQLKWSDPFGGVGTDHFRLVGPDELHIESVLHVAGQGARYLTVYHRKQDRHHKGQHAAAAASTTVVSEEP